MPSEILKKYDSKQIEKILKEGVDTEFWEVLCSAIDESINISKERHLEDLDKFESMTPLECKFKITAFNEKLVMLEYLKGLPLSIFESIQPEIEDTSNPDPYNEASDFMPNE